MYVEASRHRREQRRGAARQQSAGRADASREQRRPWRGGRSAAAAERRRGRGLTLGGFPEQARAWQSGRGDQTGVMPQTEHDRPPQPGTRSSISAADPSSSKRDEES